MIRGILYERKDPGVYQITYFAVAGMTRLKSGAMRIKTKWVTKRVEGQFLCQLSPARFEMDLYTEYRSFPSGRREWGSHDDGFLLVLLPKKIQEING